MYEQKNKYSKYLFIALLIFLAYISIMIVKPLFSSIIIGLFTVYLLMPVHRKLKGIVRNNNVSALIITLAVIASVTVSIIFLTNILVNETIAVYDKVDLAKLTEFVESHVHAKNTGQYVAAFAERGLNYTLNTVSTILLKVPEILIGLFITFVVVFFALRDFDKLNEKIRMLLPVKESYKGQIIKKFTDTMNAVVYTTFLVSIAEAIVATLGYHIFGIKAPLLWGLLTLVLSMLPFVGPAIVWIPLSIYLYFSGNASAGIGLAIYGVLLLTVLFENIIKPNMIAKEGKMHPIVAVVGVIGGISVFGVPGLILGPFLLAMFLFVLNVLFGKKLEMSL